MPRKKKIIHEPHIHVWEVDTQLKYDYCDCIDECTCTPYAYAEAVCKICNMKLDSYQIADILNGKQGPQE